MPRLPADESAKREQYVLDWIRQFNERTGDWPSVAAITEEMKRAFGEIMRPQKLYLLREQAGGPAIAHGQRRGRPPKQPARDSRPLSMAARGSAEDLVMMLLSTKEEVRAVEQTIDRLNAAGLCSVRMDVDKGKLGFHVILQRR